MCVCVCLCSVCVRVVCVCVCVCVLCIRAETNGSNIFKGKQPLKAKSILQTFVIHS